MGGEADSLAMFVESKAGVAERVCRLASVTDRDVVFGKNNFKDWELSKI